ncbi:hypothetical protein PN836_010465 [Ningiella sp. W23]|uniref:hypothetical protein n=1 Tax=Ningiella sp. W23 TaxID=3023715 RepID=UPI003756B5C6
MNTDILFPLSFLLMIFVVVKLLLEHLLKRRQMQQQTLQSAIVSGKSIPEELWQRFLMSVDPKRNDLRKAIQFFVLTIIFLGIAVLLPFEEPHARSSLLVVAMFPAGISAVYFCYWLFWYPKLNE